MTLLSKSVIRKVNGISTDETERIYAYLQGAVYCWCKNKLGKWFSAREFLGGDNFDWNGTPMIVLFKKHKNKGKTDEKAISDAGKDAGWILKKVVDDDKRNFETKKESLIRKYRWKK